MGIPTESGCERQYFDRPSGMCMGAYDCAYKGAELECLLYTRKTRVQNKVIEARPDEETKVGLAPVKNAHASQPITSLVPAVQAATIEDCFNGGKQFLRKEGFCVVESSCPYQTPIKIPKPVKQGGQIVGKDLPKCVAYCIWGCAIEGNRSLYMGSPPCCMATGVKGGDCEYRDDETAQPIGDIRVAFCKKSEAEYKEV
jgi:hypothetical protein